MQWLKQDLAAHPAACTLAYFHHPLFTSTPEPGYNGPVDDIFEALYDGGADVVLNAHSKSYERFAPQDSDGNADPPYGIREFIVGTGGEAARPDEQPRREQRGLAGVDARRAQAHPPRDELRLAVRARGRRLLLGFRHGQLPQRHAAEHPAETAAAGTAAPAKAAASTTARARRSAPPALT